MHFMMRFSLFFCLLLWSLPVRSDEAFPLITMKVQVHLMQSVANPRLQTTLTEKEVRAIFDEDFDRFKIFSFDNLYI